MNIKDFKNKSLEEITKLISTSSIEDIAKIIKELEINQPQYGLYWEKKDTEVIEKELYKDRYPYLSECKELKILNDENAKHNILIEGDNYHALKLLQYTHAEKIDVIYIDPPYNTGKKDFVYNDRYVDKEDVYRHSKWLNFMSKRLRLAKDLLSDDGVIFISIDDNELYQLKLLCDDIFGENQFVENFIWTKTATPPSLANKVRRDVEYILCYQKKKNDSRFFGRASENSDAPLANGSNRNTIITIPKNSCIFTNKKNGTISSGKKKSLLLLDDITVVDNKNANDFKIEFKSKWTQSNVDYEVSEGTFFLVKNENTFSIRYKKNTTSFIAPNKFLDKNKFPIETNEFGKKQLENILGESSFDYPKNTPLIKFLINMATYNKPNALVLDFFAGSGTTGHAVLELNKDDELNNIKSNRRFILCTNNENNICESITYERLNKIINGYTYSNENYVSGLGGNLDYYKIDFFEKENLEEDDYRKFVESKGNYAAIDNIIKIKEDTYDCVFSNEAYRIYKNSNKIVGVFTKNITDKRREKMLEYLKDNKYDSYEKKIYIYGNKKSLSSTCSPFFDGISTEIIPIDLIEILKKKPE